VHLYSLKTRVKIDLIEYQLQLLVAFVACETLSLLKLIHKYIKPLLQPHLRNLMLAEFLYILIHFAIDYKFLHNYISVHPTRLMFHYNHAYKYHKNQSNNALFHLNFEAGILQ